jgi:tetratricopeptide (TPR) repeat protein
MLIKNRVFGHWLLFVICCLVLGILAEAYALDIDRVKAAFIGGDYKAAILEGEKILADTDKNYNADELYYILGFSYLKDGNYLRASDIFEIIINEFKNSRYAPEARLGLADTYFFRGDLQKAKKGYLDLSLDKGASRLKASVYYRLSECEAKLGNTDSAKDYLAKLKQEFPQNIEAGLETCSLVPDFYYSVQVGSFLSKTNAENLARQLERKGYSAYIEEGTSQGAAIYRVRSGKLATRQEAVKLESRLSGEGYPTKVCP